MTPTPSSPPWRREDLVVAVECMFTWYWLADLCAREGIAFVLGHALYMKAIHGAKAKNDRLDAYKIAALLRGGNLPQAYVSPPAMRATRDLLRRRLHSYCYPLTVTDHYSRMLLLCKGLLSVRTEGAKPAFKRLFREVGLPDAIRTDNGAPFAS